MKNRVVRLRDVASLNISNRRQNEKKIAYLDTGNIIENRVIKIQYFDYLDNIPSRAKRKVKEEDTIFSMVRPNQKHFGYINRSMENLIVSTGFSVVTPNKNKINSRYLFYLLTNNEVINIFQKLAEGCVSTYPTLSLRDLLDFEFKLPSLEEQKRIADILTALDDKIELNNQMNQTLEEIASLLYKRWFVDFEFPDDKGNPYKSSGGEMVDSELGMIPKGWEVKELGEVLEISSGNRPVQKSEEKTKENIFPIVGASKIMGYTNNYILADTNEVLIIGRVGTLGIIQEYREKIWVSDNTLIIKSNFQNYIKQYLSNVDFYSLNSGSTQPLITQTTINKLLIVVPCNKVTDKFEKIESSNVRIKFCNTYEIKKIQRLKLELLKELI